MSVQKMSLKLVDEITPQWRPDCCGKEDYDADIVQLSCRFYPAGGSFMVVDSKSGHVGMPGSFPDIKPSAIAHIFIGDIPIFEADFEGDSESEVKASVESWAKQRIRDVCIQILRMKGVRT